MNAKHFRWLFLPIALYTLFRDYSKTIIIGSSVELHDGEYHFAGGTEPKAIAIALGIILLYGLFLLSASAKLGNPMTGVFRRLLAAILDFVLSMMAIVPIFGLVPTLMEWNRTGTFAWNFIRDTPATYDGYVSFILVILAFTCMAFYFALPLVLRLPSPGSCIMGYQIISEDGEGLTLGRALKRTAYGFKAVCTLYTVPFKPRDSENGKFWLDEKFGTRAVKIG